MLLIIWAIIILVVGFFIAMSAYRSHLYKKEVEKATKQWKDPGNILDVKRFYLKWIESCRTREQVNQLESGIEHFFFSRFNDKTPRSEFIIIYEQLMYEIRRKKTSLKNVIPSMKVIIDEIPTLSYQLKLT